MADVEPIPETELKFALDTCFKIPNLKQLYVNAPLAAQKVIGLSFYSTVFPEQIDANRYRALLREYASDLEEQDFAYLIRNEDDVTRKQYFTDLLAEKQATAVAAAAQAQGEDHRHTIGIIRSEDKAERVSVDLNAEAIKRHFAEVEQVQAAQAAKADVIRRRERRLEILKNILIVILVGVGIGGGGYILTEWRNKRSLAEMEVLRQEKRLTREAAERQAAKREAAYRQTEAERVANEAERRQWQQKADRLFLEHQAAERARRAEKEKR